MGVRHGEELFILFSPSFFEKKEADRAMSAKMVGLWVNFAKNGNPGQDWKPMQRNGNPEYAVLDLEPLRMVNDEKEFEDRMDFYEEYFSELKNLRIAGEK